MKIFFFILIFWFSVVGVFLYLWKGFWDMVNDKEAKCRQEGVQMAADGTEIKNR